MSRIGRQPIELPAGVNVSISPGRVMVNGPLGELSSRCPSAWRSSRATRAHGDAPDRRGEDRALHGLTRTLVANMVEGVTKGFEKRLEIQGVGYRAQRGGPRARVGYSHPVVKPPQGINFEVPQRPRSSSRESTSSRSARSPPRSARAPARALQGQGHPLRRRVRPQQGREASLDDHVDDTSCALRRHRRVRQKISGTAERPASSCSARTEESSLSSSTTRAARRSPPRGLGGRKKTFKGTKTEQAAEVGKLLASREVRRDRAVVFDRGGFLFHGRVKALADAAREGGLTF